jgi:hypothetical protein
MALSLPPLQQKRMGSGIVKKGLLELEILPSKGAAVLRPYQWIEAERGHQFLPLNV